MPAVTRTHGSITLHAGWTSPHRPDYYHSSVTYLLPPTVAFLYYTHTFCLQLSSFSFHTCLRGCLSHSAGYRTHCAPLRCPRTQSRFATAFTTLRGLHTVLPQDYAYAVLRIRLPRIHSPFDPHYTLHTRWILGPHAPTSAADFTRSALPLPRTYAPAARTSLHCHACLHARTRIPWCHARYLSAVDFTAWIPAPRLPPTVHTWVPVYCLTPPRGLYTPPYYRTGLHLLQLHTSRYTYLHLLPACLSGLHPISFRLHTPLCPVGFCLLLHATFLYAWDLLYRWVTVPHTAFRFGCYRICGYRSCYLIFSPHHRLPPTHVPHYVSLPATRHTILLHYLREVTLPACYHTTAPAASSCRTCVPVFWVYPARVTAAVRYHCHRAPTPHAFYLHTHHAACHTAFAVLPGCLFCRTYTCTFSPPAVTVRYGYLAYVAPSSPHYHGLPYYQFCSSPPTPPLAHLRTAPDLPSALRFIVATRSFYV